MGRRLRRLRPDRAVRPADPADHRAGRGQLADRPVHRPPDAQVAQFHDQRHVACSLDQGGRRAAARSLEAVDRGDPARDDLPVHRRSRLTTLAESTTSDQLSSLLNHYLQGLCDEILAAEGTVCRFIGDAVFALWSAPIEQSDHAARAIACALAIDAHAEKFRLAQKALGLSFGKTRIGVHSVEAMVGFFGANDRMEYTALGDNVNLFSRLESLKKFFGTRIAISEEAKALSPGVPLRLVANVVVKGKILPMKIYEPEDGVVAFHLERLRRGILEQEVVLQEK
jgi:class 3 adenylate cyclase